MAAELVGGAVLSASLQVMFEKIASAVVEDYLRRKKLCDIEGLLGKLKIMLSSLNAVLDDAELKQISNRGVKEWLDELQEAVYDAEDLLGEIEYDALRLKVEAEFGTSSTNKVSNFFSTVFNPTDDRERKTKMEEIVDRLEYIEKRKDVLGLRVGVEERPARRLPSTSLLDESEVYGRDDDKDAIIKLLADDDLGGKRISVIPIVGMGGVGKTTLAQAVYNDKEVQKHFEVKAWVCVSEDFDACRLTKTILGAITSDACGATDLNYLQIKLKERLTRMKFFIVLDDMWNENYVDWDVIRMPFKDGAQGSKIIVTTRSKKVASIMGTIPMPIYLRELSNDASWQLFVKHASGNEDCTTHPDLERIGRKIVEKCKGLPLATKTLGGLLRSTTDVLEWERISESDIWDLQDEQSNILPALRLSYHYLPSHLKRCFAFCSIFPKDFEFKKEELVFLWMSDNLLEHPRGNKRIEEVADEYFDNLVSRSFFQHLNTNHGSSFVMHDLMVDLAKFVYGKYYIHLEGGNSDEIVLKRHARHLAYQIELFNCPPKLFNTASKATRLRTFFSLNRRATIGFGQCPTILVHDLLKLRCLRFLSLVGYADFRHLPDSIGELKHICYLDISCTSINMLPDSVIMLYNLNVLKLRGCGYLTNLPKDFHHLINLRYLDVEYSGLVEMPTKISKMKNIQILSSFVVGKDSGASIAELGGLSNLRGQLSIENLQNIVKAKDASEAKLKDKGHLEKLELKWVDDTNYPTLEREVLDNLCPHKTLKELEIYKYGGTTFPNWLGHHSICNLVDLKLWGCKNCIILPSLGQLSSLKTLKIEEFHSIVIVGPEFHGNSSSLVKPFASLETLEFSRMSNWEEWSMPIDDTQASAFPKLKSLVLCYCKRLTGNLPCFLPYLTQISIFGCPQLASSLPRMPVVSSVQASACKRLTGFRVVDSFSSLHATLKTLSVFMCKNFEVPLCRKYESLEELSIQIDSCCSIGSIFPLNSFPRVRDVKLSGFENLESLSSVLDERCEELTSLSSLSIFRCPKLVFPRGGLPCPNLTSLCVGESDKLTASWRSCNLQSLLNLKKFNIYNEYLESFPDEGLLPSTITHLKIERLPYFETLNTNGLQQLTSLEELCIHGCPNLHAMSEKGLPTSLVRLRISGSPLLKEKCQKEEGEYWNKIAHIPDVSIW